MHYHPLLNRLDIHEKGVSLLSNPIANKGTAFSKLEREQLRLVGLLPPVYHSLEEQVELEWHKLDMEESSFAKHRFLRHLQDTNETLFYALVASRPHLLLPLIYTPTVGVACQEFSRTWSKPRGLFISYEQKDRLEEILRSAKEQNPSILLVTDSERILGLGDLGLGGLGISIGKLSLYTVFAGIHPLSTLPLVLDVGTNNAKNLNDPLYLGLKKPRIRGKEYDDFIEAFVLAVKRVFPKALLQWEDFSKDNAKRILETYRNKITSFNDDIQGTAGVTLAGLLSALRKLNGQLEDQRFVLYGAGSAAIGIADLLVSCLMKRGLSEEEATSRFFILNSKGLLVKEAGIVLMSQQKRFAKTVDAWNVQDKTHITLRETIAHAKPTILIGTSADPGSFTEEIVKMMSEHTPRPIIFPLSNPNSSSEADPKDLIRWSKGRAIVATGSPYPDVEYEGKIYPISQCNNAYIFPGLGLGVIVSGTTIITDSLFEVAASTLSDLSAQSETLFPGLASLRSVSEKIAFAVAKEAMAQGLADPINDVELQKLIEKTAWKPIYPTLSKVS